MELSHNTFKILLVLNLVLIINLVSAASPNSDLDVGDICVLKDNVNGTCKEIFQCEHAKQLFREKKNSEIVGYRCKFRGRMHYVCCPSPISRIDEIPATEKILETTTTQQTTTSAQDDYNEVEVSIESEVEQQTSSTAAPTTEEASTVASTTENEDNELDLSIESEVEQQSSSIVATTTTEAASTVGSTLLSQTRYQKAICENETPDIQLGVNIVGGEAADIGEFPFQAAIGYRKVLDEDEFEDNPIQYLCGGSLIASDVVISAAHCFGYPQYTPEIVKLGRTSLNDDDDNDYSDGDDVEIEKVIMHPEYSKANKFNDIALIKLKRAVNDTRFPIIKPICLSMNDENLPENFTITGFGRNDLETQKTSDWLIKAIVNEYQHEKCNEMMLGATTIIETQTCASGYKGADSCQGDSGGPMSYERDVAGGGKLAYLHGIVSYGASCGSALPGVYTKVNKYLGWIEQELNLMEE